MEFFHKKLELSAPFVSENGGGIFFHGKKESPPFSGAVFDQGLWKLSLGTPYAVILSKLQEIKKELGLDIRCFSDMEPEEIAMWNFFWHSLKEG